jgi:hypothetical protein
LDATVIGFTLGNRLPWQPSHHELLSRRRRFKISYVEIYLEELNDLLSLGGQAVPQLREDKDGNTVLSGVEEREVATFEDAVVRCSFLPREEFAIGDVIGGSHLCTA